LNKKSHINSLTCCFWKRTKPPDTCHIARI